MQRKIIKSIKTTSPSKTIGVTIDVWKEKNKLQQYNTYGFMELAHIESGGNEYYKTSNLQFNDDLELCDYDGNFPNGLPNISFRFSRRMDSILMKFKVLKKKKSSIARTGCSVLILIEFIKFELVVERK